MSIDVLGNGNVYLYVLISVRDILFHLFVLHRESRSASSVLRDKLAARPEDLVPVDEDMAFISM